MISGDFYEETKVIGRTFQFPLKGNRVESCCIIIELDQILFTLIFRMEENFTHGKTIMSIRLSYCQFFSP